MTSVATLVAAPGDLPSALVERVAASLPGAGAVRWLAEGCAADLPFAPVPDGDNARWTRVARDVLGAGAPVDVVVQPSLGRRKRLLLADMDSTLIQEECIDELADALGRRADVAAITAASTRGETDFATSLVARVALLAGLDVARIGGIVARVTPVPGAATLAATMRAHGARTAVASGGFTLFTAPVAARLGFERHHANVLEIADGRLTGRLVPPVLGPDDKRDTLLSLRAEHGIAAGETLAVGDGANDIPMLREAGLGVAYRAKPKVAAAVPARVDHGDLTALLYLQGFSRREFVA